MAKKYLFPRVSVSITINVTCRCGESYTLTGPDATSALLTDGGCYGHYDSESRCYCSSPMVVAEPVCPACHLRGRVELT